jgi:hypothetical protein
MKYSQPLPIFLAIFLSAGMVNGEMPTIIPSVTNQLRDDVYYLSSEDLRGRSVADDTIDVAAHYIASRMADAGLDMTAVDGSAFQPVSIPLDAQAGEAARNYAQFLTLDDEAKSATAELDRDMMPMSIGTPDGIAKAPVAFAGYGVTAPELGYDDYSGIDVSGHVVIVLRKEPQSSDPTSRFDGLKHTRHAFFATKVANAIKNGAVAIIFVNDAASTEQEVQQVQTRIDSELARKSRLMQQRESLPTSAVNTRDALSDKIAGVDSMLVGMQAKRATAAKGVMGISTTGNPANEEKNVPVISVSRTMISELLEDSLGRPLAEIEAEIDENLIPQSKLLAGVTVDLSAKIEPTRRVSNNVIGVLDGRGLLASQTVIIGAHYDHVGMGGVGSLAPGTIAVHNGADDNASGTATLLSAAAQIRQQLATVDNHRRVVFIAFTGEERGLLGSKHYVRNSRFPLSETVTMINLDMVGRLRNNELTVYGTGSADVMDSIVEQSNASLATRGEQFTLFKVPTGYGPSDHQTFYEAGVPVLFYFTGLHNDYHRPTDDFDKIDFGGLTRITDMVTQSCTLIAVSPQRPHYYETEKKFKMRWQITAILGVSLSDTVTETGQQRLTISALKAGGPAITAGIQIGDELIQVGKHAVKHSNEVLSSMRGRSPGETIELRVIRGGQFSSQIKVIRVTLAAIE